MNKIFTKLFKESMIGPVGLITGVMLVGLLYLVPYLSHEQSKKDAFEEAQRLKTYITMFRAYYNSNILVKIRVNENFGCLNYNFL